MARAIRWVRLGEQIGLAGRIVAVADVFDVITSSRSYKGASDAMAGREEIARCAALSSTLVSCARSSRSRWVGCGLRWGRCRGCRMRRFWAGFR